MRKLSVEALRAKQQGLRNEWGGVYQLNHPKIKDYAFQVIASDGMGWDHVSACLRSKINGKFVERCPTWSEMCYIKDFFFDRSETVVQYHPAEADYVNHHYYVLHLWRSQNEKMPVPETIMV